MSAQERRAPHIRAGRSIAIRRTLRIGLLLALAIAPGTTHAADRHTCKVISGLLEMTDRGLADAALGTAGMQPASGIATYARQALEFAESFSARDPLPEKVVDALSAMADAASAHFSIADAAPTLLESGLIIQGAMPQICPQAEAPDLSRHAG